MRFGEFELHLLAASRMKVDGGMLFGVVPKVLWERQKPADADNLIDAACVVAVIRHGDQVIVCDTGLGDQHQQDGLLEGLKRLGIGRDEVDVVLLTHLHRDHAGGVTRLDPHSGTLELTFPKARHLVQRAEWDYAQRPDARSRTEYLEEDYLLPSEAGAMELLAGDAEVLPGVELRLTAGHTPGHQVCILRSGDLACALTGDLVPMRPHLRPAWNLGADLDVRRVMDEKARLLGEAQQHRWLVVLSHEPEEAAGYLGADGTFEPEPALAI